MGNAVTVTDTAVAIDTVWVVVAGCLLLFMQAGFAMPEAGFSRMKNSGAVMAKVLVNLCFAFAAFWAIGYAIALATATTWSAPPAGSSSWAIPTASHRSPTRRSMRRPSGSSRPPSPRSPP